MTRVVNIRKLSNKFLAFALMVGFTSAFAANDATKVPANPITNTTVQSPSATVLAPAVNPATLAACPGTISNCPDINNMGGSQTTCPDNCAATRTVTATPGYQAGWAGYVPPVSKVTPPSCPVGYFPGQTFNPQPDYVFMSPPRKTPITWTMWASGLSTLPAGICGPTGNSGSTVGQAPCWNGGSTGSNVGGDWGNPCKWSVNNGVPNPGNWYCAPTEGWNMIYLTSATYSWSNCWGSCNACSGVVNITDNYGYGWNQMACTPQAGFYLSGTSSDSSVVCVRSKTQWRQLNQ
jgi:hypothetical protein